MWEPQLYCEVLLSLVRHPHSVPGCGKVCDEERPSVLESPGGCCCSSLLSCGLLAVMASTPHSFTHIYLRRASRHGERVRVNLGDPPGSSCELDSRGVFSWCGGVQGLRLLPLQNGDHSSPPDSLPHHSRLSRAFLSLLFLFFRSSLSGLWQTLQSAACETSHETRGSLICEALKTTQTEACWNSNAGC